MDLTVTNVSESTTSAVEHEGQNYLFGADGDESDPDYNPVHLADLTAKDEILVKETRNLLSDTRKDLVVGVSALIKLHDLFQKTWTMIDSDETNVLLEYQRTASTKMSGVAKDCHFVLIESTKVLGDQFNTIRTHLPCTKEKQYHYNTLCRKPCYYVLSIKDFAQHFLLFQYCQEKNVEPIEVICCLYQMALQHFLVDVEYYRKDIWIRCMEPIHWFLKGENSM